jgi:ribosomal protein S18 acetylase RimI-like enzyme
MSSDFQVEILTPQALAAREDLIALIGSAQSVVGARCIHSDFEISPQTYAAENAAEVAYALAIHSVNSVESAIIGADVSDELARAWLRGPFVASTIAQSAQSVNAAFNALQQHFNGRANVWDAYIEPSHRDAIAWYASRGFDARKRNSVYTLLAQDALTIGAIASDPSVAPPRSDAMIDAVTQLASESFPGGYLTRKNFAAPPSDEAITLIMREGETLLGYVYASYEAGAVEATIDNLAVAETARRNGIGRTLLRAALHWAIVERSAPKVALVVTEGNTRALSLYESVGFRLLVEGIHLRLDRKIETV